MLDDEPFMLKLLAHMLASLGFASITTCDSGRAALALFDGPDTPPDLILLDLNMPEMDGVEFVRYLVERRYVGSLVLVSGEDERMQQSVEKLVRAHKISILGHLCKPASPEKLAELLGQWTPPPAGKVRVAKKAYDADEVRAAIEGGRLINYYQPKVSVSTSEVVGVETLVRWHHHEDGVVAPDQFIGVAEAHGLIDGLTQVVFTNALADAKGWQEAGLALRVAVNISMDNLESLDFTDFVAAQTLAAGVPPQQVVLEVTESRLMQDARTPLEVLARLRLKRFRLSIDDFGTGHSSLAQLRDIPFDELKIDQGFVHGAWSNETLRVMYDASLNLARQLGMEVVAEGIEDREDWELLRRTGCDIAQGYLIARPMPAADVAGWIADWQSGGFSRLVVGD
ncbi:EAL domain-containing response regulator [Methylogaea oryzae]|nr:EAL domain-containing response regulator [Methylogaea oryzae]